MVILNKILLALLGIVLLPVLFLLVFLYFAIWSRAYYILRAKGVSPLKSGLICFSWLIIAMPFLITNSFSPTFWQIFAICTPFLNLLIALLVKQNSRREFGKRKATFNNKIAAYLVFPVMLFLFIVDYIFQKELLTWDRIGKVYLLGTITLYAYFITRDKLFKKPDIEEKLGNDHRKSVLYIRSFKQDMDPFYTGNLYAKKIDSQLDDKLFLFKEGTPLKGIQFQQYFSKEINEKLGTLIGLGNPEDAVPFEGITSSYYADTNWENNFIEWVKNSSCIITTPANTKGLLFELDFIKKNNLQRSFFIFTKPVKPKGFYRMFMVLMQWSRSFKEIKWSQYAKELSKLGFYVQNQTPAPGTIITFNERSEQVILKQGLFTPANYIDTVLDYLKRAN